MNPKHIYEFTNQRKLTKQEFIRWFQKRFLYTIRKFQMIKPNDIIYYKKSNDFRSIVLEELLKILSEKSAITLTSNKLKKINKIAIPSTLDIESYEIIKTIMKGNEKDLKLNGPIIKKTIKPLYLFLDKEILLYAKLRKLKFKKEQQKTDEISKFVDDMEANHPELKHAIVNGLLNLKK